MKLKYIFISFALFSLGCSIRHAYVINNTNQPAQVIVVDKPKKDILGFSEHLEKLNPSLRAYVTKLYSDYQSKEDEFSTWAPLQQYILKTQKSAKNYFKRYKNPITKADVYRVAYGITEYSSKWGIDPDITTSYMTQESGFLDIIGDLTYRHSGKKKPPSMWSVGIGQVQIKEAERELTKRGVSSKGLTVDDLVYFKLLNMDISIHIMSNNVKKYGVSEGLRRYNGGSSYPKKVLAIYSRRSEWKDGNRR